MTHDPDFEDRNFPKFNTDEEAKEWHRKHIAELMEKSTLAEIKQKIEDNDKQLDQTIEQQLQSKYHFKYY